MTEYSEIQNYRQLIQARRSLDSKLSEKEKELKYRFTAAREFYTPANIALLAFKRATSMLNAGKIALFIVRYLKDYLTRKKEESARRRYEETEPGHEGTETKGTTEKSIN